MTTLDSREETKAHIRNIRSKGRKFIDLFLEELMAHDASKLEGLEKRLFDELAGTQGKHEPLSKEYEKDRIKLQEALNHHYASNRHHPEHFPNGVAGMNLVDFVIMILDWCATSEKYPTGDIYQSIEKLKDRFNLSDDIVSIAKNTASDIFKMECEVDRMKRNGNNECTP